MNTDDAAAELENYSQVMPHYSYTGHDAKVLPSFLLNHSQQIIRLNLSHNQLDDLRGLEKFVNLDDLNLDNNLINDATEFPKLSISSLTLNNNHIANLHILLEKLTRAFPCLEYLSLLGNEACPSDLMNLSNSRQDYSQYRSLVACCLPNLKFLDFQAITSEERIYGYQLTIKLNAGEQPFTLKNQPIISVSKDAESHSSETRFTDELKGKVLLGRVRYNYSGKNSEGNRFIRNSDL